MLPLRQTKNTVGQRASSGTVPNTSSRQFEKKMYLILSGLGSLFLLNIVRAVPRLDVAKVKPIWTNLKGNRVTCDFVGIYICEMTDLLKCAVIGNSAENTVCSCRMRDSLSLG